MAEKKFKPCKICEEVKEAVASGFYGDGKTRKWTNEFGQLWNGRVCPECNVIRAKIIMREFRAKSNGNE